MKNNILDKFSRAISTADGNFKVPSSWQYISPETEKRSLARTLLNGLSLEYLSLTLCVLAFFHSCFFFYSFLDSPYLEFFGFRQAQTALTSYYLIKNGFSLHFWTPVVGQPWSIPFEFPIYQEIVALLQPVLNLPLIEVGRSVTWGISILCLVPIYFTLKSLNLNHSVRLFALTLYLTSPLYLFWDTTLLIDGTALFFLLCSIYCSVELIQKNNSIFLYAGLFVSLSLCLLQKITTGLPLVGLLSVYFLVDAVRTKKKIPTRSLVILLILALALTLGVVWTNFSEQIRMQNATGMLLSNDRLRYWYYGDIKQRLSKDLWLDLLYYRILTRQLGGVLGLLLICLGFYLASSRERKIMGIALSLGIAPIAIFTNLYVFHEYYSIGIMVFFYTVVVYACQVINTKYLTHYRTILFLIFSFFIYENICNFYNGYYYRQKIYPNPSDLFIYRVANYVKKITQPDDIIMWFGDNWSSEVPFFSERKTLALPRNNLNLTIDSSYLLDVFTHREKYLDHEPNLIVVCPYHYEDGNEVTQPPDPTTDSTYIRSLIVKRYGSITPAHHLSCDFYSIPKDHKFGT